MKYKRSNVDSKKVREIFGELSTRCGSPEAAARYAGIGTTTAYRIVHNEHQTVQRATAKKVIQALVRKRKEKYNGEAMWQQYLKFRAKVEAELEAEAVA